MGKFAEFSGKGAGDKKGKEKAPKAEKKKEPEKKKEKKEEPAGDEIPMEPKKKDPMDALPKGTFDLENYSIWRGDYKYNDELTMVFMSCNLIGGMFQRLEKLKKNAFASCCLFGKDNDSSISGIWVFKGHELAFELSEDWQIDYASYDWKKLDSKSEECKKLVGQYWKWEGEDQKGRAFNQGKILK